MAEEPLLIPLPDDLLPEDGLLTLPLLEADVLPLDELPSFEADVLPLDELLPEEEPDVAPDADELPVENDPVLELVVGVLGLAGSLGLAWVSVPAAALERGAVAVPETTPLPPEDGGGVPLYTRVVLL